MKNFFINAWGEIGQFIEVASITQIENVERQQKYSVDHKIFVQRILGNKPIPRHSVICKTYLPNCLKKFLTEEIN